MTQGLSQGERDELAASLDRFSRKADELLASNNNATNITVSAGGFGVWLSVTCAAVMLAAMMIAVPIAAFAYLNAQNEIRVLRDSDNAIRAYINTGILKPREETDDAE